jgi:CRP/FNR family cyclic AMP-dependent transcriptional regulator
LQQGVDFMSIFLRQIERSLTASKRKTPFDAQAFLAKAGVGRTISKYAKHKKVFSQGDAADAVFYIQKGKVHLTVVSDHGKEAVVAV